MMTSNSSKQLYFFPFQNWHPRSCEWHVNSSYLKIQFCKIAPSPFYTYLFQKYSLTGSSIWEWILVSKYIVSPSRADSHYRHYSLWSKGRRMKICTWSCAKCCKQFYERKHEIDRKIQADRSNALTRASKLSVRWWASQFKKWGWSPSCFRQLWGSCEFH